ncbi:MAG TPA: sigma-54 dependent transcriptional regulator [Thermoanaerobaculia bacterium]|jgi:two-component system response regulator HydG|nr:sigma-54 dependent transcriptional regulator [Thermoanaerobaculia bacterium]
MTTRIPIHVLLVEDDEAGQRALARYLRDVGFEVTAVSDAEAAEAKVAEGDFSVLLTDYKLPGIDGIELVRRVKARAPNCPCLMITAHGEVQSAVEAMRAGASHFVEKPVNSALLVELIKEAYEKHAMRLELDLLRRQLNDRYGFDGLVGTSPAMRAVLDRIKLAAPASSTVLITGESGTGKEVVARALHLNSLRKNGPFIAVNCAALSESLVESELFGHEKGAFTGAVSTRRGFFEAAEGGTLFIDEVGDLPLALQPKILRALELRAITRVGSTREVPIDVRIIAATHQGLEAMIKEGRFRADLYYRLAVIRIELPALVSRRSDIRLLISAFLETLAESAGRPPCEISPEALDALECYDWPGNVRELKNVVESLVVLNARGRIDLEDLPAAILRGKGEDVGTMPSTSPVEIAEPNAPPLARPGQLPTLFDVERKTILSTLEACGGNRTRAAQVLGIGLRTIQRKLREFGYD